MPASPLLGCRRVHFPHRHSHTRSLTVRPTDRSGFRLSGGPSAISAVSGCWVVAVGWVRACLRQCQQCGVCGTLVRHNRVRRTTAAADIKPFGRNPSRAHSSVPARRSGQIVLEGRVRDCVRRVVEIPAIRGRTPPGPSGSQLPSRRCRRFRSGTFTYVTWWWWYECIAIIRPWGWFGDDAFGCA